MAPSSRTFRIFVSSTFSDLKTERDALQQYVFPRLRELCLHHRARFQAIDLRWGVSDEAGLDQRTMQICLDEIARCQRSTRRPNFIMLLGERYGWRPLPGAIPATEFDQITTLVAKKEQTLLEQWYRRDDNAVLPTYRLQPRTGNFVDYQVWERQVERPLHEILLHAVAKLPLAANEYLKYGTSATEQEIMHGALQVSDSREHVFGFFRQVRNSQNLLHDLPGGYLDLNEEGNLDEDAHQHLEDLKARLVLAFPGNIHSYWANWSGKGMTTEHIGALPEKLNDCLALLEDMAFPSTLCADVWRRLACIILQEIEQFEQDDPLEKEIADHVAFGANRARFFTGQAPSLEAISAYVRDSDPHPFVLWGRSGVGKSALLARAGEQVRGELPDAELMMRFIGATPESSNVRALLESLCREISRCYGVDESNIPSDYKGLLSEFPKRLAFANAEKPLILFLDALDQLLNTDNAHSLLWLPVDLPAHVRLIVSTLWQDSSDVATTCYSALKAKLPPASMFELKPLSPDEGSQLLDTWLREARRTLKPEQRAVVMDQFSGNGLPLYLKLALQEACLWHSYDGVQTLGADIPDIINNFFQRLSTGADHGVMLVTRSLGYLSAAQNGLSEDEILDVLSRDTHVMQDFQRRSPKSPQVDRLPVVVWSRLYFDLEPYLAERSTDDTVLLTFYHRQLRDAIQRRYSPEDIILYHVELAKYFESRWKEPYIRALNELPYHYYNCYRFEKLQEILTNLEYIHQRCKYCDVYALIEDYEKIPEAALVETEPLRRFLRVHAQALMEYREFFSTYLFETSGEERDKLEGASRGWPWPYLRTKDLPIPEISDWAGPNFSLRKTLNFQFGAIVPAASLAPMARLAFFVSQMGAIQPVSLENARQSPETISVLHKRPLLLGSSADGTYLAVAYETADANIVHVSYDAKNNITNYKTVTSISYLLPEFEKPFFKFIDSKLYYQRSSGELVSYDPASEQESIILDRTVDGAELSCVLQLDRDIVCTFRHKSDTRVMVVSLDGPRLQSSMLFRGMDLSAACVRDRASFYLAFTSSEILGLRLNREVEIVYRQVVKEVPEILFSLKNSLLWAANGTIYAQFTDRLERSSEYLAKDKLLVAPIAVDLTNDRELCIVSRAGLSSFRISEVTEPGKTHMLRVFEIGEDNHVALGREKELLYLIDVGKQTGILLWENADSDFITDIDGLNDLVIIGKSGTGRWCNIAETSVKPLDGLPTNLQCITGVPLGGFWMADNRARLYHFGSDRQIDQYWDFPDRNLQGKWICSDGKQLILCCTQLLMDYPLYVLLFIDLGRNGSGLRLSGKRTFDMHQFEINSMTWDSGREELYLIGRTDNGCMIKKGKTKQFIEEFEETHRVQDLDLVISHVAVDADDSALWLVSSKGNLFRVQTNLFNVEAVLSPIDPITGLAIRPIRPRAIACISNEERIFQCSFVDGNGV